MKRERGPVEGKRKWPSGQVKAMGPKAAAREPLHGAASADMLAALRDVDFPASKQDVLEAVRGRRFSLGDGRTVRLEVAVEKAARAEFGSAQEVVHEANALWDDIDRAGHEE